MSRDPLPGAGVVVPLRSFSVGKARLAGHLDAPARAALVRLMAERVVDAARGLPTAVVSNDREVRAWAQARDLSVVADAGSLDAAAGAGRDWVRARGFTRVVVAHGDLPFATSFDSVIRVGAGVAALVPCHRGDGTPVLSVPAGVDFRFAYGPGSFDRHVAEAARLGLELRVVDDPTLAFDVDEPTDLARLSAGTRLDGGR